MVRVVSTPLKRSAAKVAMSKTAAKANASKRPVTKKAAVAEAKPSKPAVKRGGKRSIVKQSDSENEEELERVSLDSLSENGADKSKKNIKKSKKSTGKKTTIAKSTNSNSVKSTKSNSAKSTKSNSAKSTNSNSAKSITNSNINTSPMKTERPKSNVSPSRSPQRRAGRPHREVKHFLGSKFAAGTARKLFLESEVESIVYERSTFEPGKTRRPRVAWNENEISNLYRGVEIYGEGAWSSILQDRNLRFHPVRTQIDLKDKWRNLTSYVPYQQHPIRQFVLVNSQHNEILTPAGNQHVFNNRWPRDAALKVATRDEFYPIDESTGKHVDSIIIHLKEAMDAIGRSERPQVVHVYRGTRTLQRPRANVAKFEGYAAIWTGKVEKIGEELLIKPGDILSPEEFELRRNSASAITKA